MTYGLGVRGEHAIEQLEDETTGRIDLAVSERNPLVDESSLFRIGAQESAVGCKRDD